MPSPLFDRVIESGILFLLLFTPLALGSVHDWSSAVMELVSFGVFFAWVLKSLWSGEGLFPQEPRTAGALRKMAAPAGLLACVAVVQMIPLPPFLLSALSPGTSGLYQSLLDNPEAAWRTISVHPDATMNHLLRLCSYAAVFTVIAGHYRSEEKIKLLFRSIIGMGVFIALLGLLQKVFGNGKPLWFVTPGPGWNYLGPFINKNHFAGYLEMAAMTGFGYYLYAASRIQVRPAGRSRIRQVLSFIDNSRLPAVSIALAAVLVMSGALFMSLSRGGIAGFVFSLAVFIVLVRSRRSLRKRKAFLALAGGLVALAVIAAAWSMLESRFGKSAAEGAARITTWRDSLGIVRDHPLLGTGLGTFDRIYSRYQTRYPHLYFEHPENEYVEVLTDAGLVGIIVVAGLMAGFFPPVIRRWRERHNPFVTAMTAAGIASSAAMMAHGMVDFNLRIPANAMLLTITAAATFAAVFNIESRRQ